jgi:hypothetical protein
MIRWRDKLILAKIESVYGTDPTPTGAANAILMTDVTLQPLEGNDEDRELLKPYFGNQGSLLGGSHVVMSGSTELAGSGAAGTAPAWGPLARACAMAQVVNASVSVVYSPITDSQESITIWFWRGGTRHKIIGARGNAVLTIEAQGIPRIRWTFTGLYVDPTDVAQATPTFTAWQKPLVATKANTPVFEIDDVAFVMRKLELNLGNDVQPRLLINSEGVIITDKAEMIDFTIESVALATLDPFAKARSKTPIKLECTHGTVAGNICAIVAPICELQRPTGFENAQGIEEWPLKAKPLPNTGNDQFSITLT